MLRNRMRVTLFLLLLGITGCAQQQVMQSSSRAAPVDTGAAGCPELQQKVGSDAPPRLLRQGALGLTAAEVDSLAGARVLLAVMVDGRGRPIPCTLRVLESSDPRLTAAARAALLASRYAPATLKGEPVPVWIEQPFEVTRSQTRGYSTHQ